MTTINVTELRARLEKNIELYRNSEGTRFHYADGSSVRVALLDTILSDATYIARRRGKLSNTESFKTYKEAFMFYVKNLMK
ncbi:hypothetical protein PM116P4_00032 [Parabacteroides phage PM116P4]|nr:hypothetical protein PM116P4_00032 [Parabacteroides phage PM116P4]WAX17525.1 hypothetical protein PM116P5_00009 [Parabacteroides phage PM116P5]